MRKPLPATSISHLASRIATNVDVTYEQALRSVKAFLILASQMTPSDVRRLMVRYRKFQGIIPLDIDKVHE